MITPGAFSIPTAFALRRIPSDLAYRYSPMYTPQLFQVTDPEVIRAFIEENSFGLLISSLDGSEIQDTHTPLLLSEDSKYLYGHIARANSHWKDWEQNKQVKVIFHGPHCYVSPTYYQSELNVPTWNYTAVSIKGEIELIEDLEQQKSFMHWLVNTHEMSLPHPWKFDETNELFMKLFKAVVFFRIRVLDITAKFKLNQNKELSDQQSVASKLASSDSSFDRKVAELMQTDSQK